MLDRRVEGRGDHGERGRPDRKVDVEDPPPGQVVDEKAAEQGADHGREPEDGAEEALVAAAVARRDDVPDDGHRHDQEPAAAESLQRAEGDQLRHVLADPAQRRADQEDDDRRLEDDLAAVEVADLAVQRTRNRRREQVRGHDPGEMGEPAEVADDRRQRGRDDRLVERREQQHQQERAEDQAHALGLRRHAASARRSSSVRPSRFSRRSNRPAQSEERSRAASIRAASDSPCSARTSTASSR